MKKKMLIACVFVTSALSAMEADIKKEDEKEPMQTTEIKESKRKKLLEGLKEFAKFCGEILKSNDATHRVAMQRNRGYTK